MAHLVLVSSVLAAIVLIHCSTIATSAILTPSAPESEVPDGRYNEPPLPASVSSSSSTRRQLANILARIMEESQSANQAQLHENHRGFQRQSTLDDPDQSAADEDELIADIGTDSGEYRQWSQRLATSSKSDDLPRPHQVAVNSAPSSSLPAVAFERRVPQLVAAGLGRRQRGTGASKRGPGVCINSCLTGGMTFVRCKSMCH